MCIPPPPGTQAAPLWDICIPQNMCVPPSGHVHPLPGTCASLRTCAFPPWSMCIPPLRGHMQPLPGTPASLWDMCIPSLGQLHPPPGQKHLPLGLSADPYCFSSMQCGWCHLHQGAFSPLAAGEPTAGLMGCVRGGVARDKTTAAKGPPLPRSCYLLKLAMWAPVWMAASISTTYPTSWWKTTCWSSGKTLAMGVARSQVRHLRSISTSRRGRGTIGDAGGQLEMLGGNWRCWGHQPGAGPLGLQSQLPTDTGCQTGEHPETEIKDLSAGCHECPCLKELTTSLTHYLYIII